MRASTPDCFRDLLYPAISVILTTWNDSIETTPLEFPPKGWSSVTESCRYRWICRRFCRLILL